VPDVGERLALFLGADAIRHFEENDGEPILPNGLAHPVIPTIQPSELTGKALGFAGIDNELYYLDKTLMLFGDAKGFTGEIVKALSANK